MYLKLDLPEVLCEELKELIKELQQNLFSPQQVLSQLDPAAGLGCHPFHVTILGKLQAVCSDKNQLTGFCQGVSSWLMKDEYAPRIEISISHQIKISRQGRILLIINDAESSIGPNSIRGFTSDLCSHHGIQRDRVNDYYIRPDTEMHITIGTMTEPNFLGRTITMDTALMQRLFTQSKYRLNSVGWDY